MIPVPSDIWGRMISDPHSPCCWMGGRAADEEGRDTRISIHHRWRLCFDCSLAIHQPASPRGSRLGTVADLLLVVVPDCLRPIAPSPTAHHAAAATRAPRTIGPGAPAALWFVSLVVRLGPGDLLAGDGHLDTATTNSCIQQGPSSRTHRRYAPLINCARRYSCCAALTRLSQACRHRPS
eukprot:COSAG01_NODE_49_length_31891_cov_29.945773_23_plen_180_part_00